MTIGDSQVAMRDIGTSVVVGPNGFIGSNFAQALEKAGTTVFPIGREDSVAELPDETIDCVFFCAGNSAAFLTEDDPEYCLRRNVIELYNYLTELDYRTFLHLSSTSVYPPGMKEKTEDSKLDLGDISLYGSHKLMSERYVTQYAPKWIILRPAYLYGPGLWKNVFYDIRTGRRNLYLDPDSELAALDVRHLARIAIELVKSGGKGVFNVGSSHVVSVRELLELVPDDFTFHNERYIDQRGISLEKIHEYWNEDVSREEHLASIAQFLREGTVNREKGL